MTPDRRRTNLAGRIARATYPLRHIPVGEILAEAPCRLIGHDLWEVPLSLRKSKGNKDGARKLYKCKRCSLVSGSTS